MDTLARLTAEPHIAGSLVLAAVALGAAVPWIVRRYAPESRISVPIALAALLAIALWSLWIIPPTMLLPATLLLGFGLLVLAIVDGEVMRLPDAVTFPLGVLGLAVGWYLGEVVAHLVGALAGYAAFALIGWGYARLRGREGLGLGDAKLAAVAGAWLGWMGLPSVVLIAALAGLAVFCIAALRRGRAALGEAMPFGVPLAFAIWIGWLYGPLI